MSVEILFDLQRELRRLFIAGSGMAAGDASMKKLLPQLQKLGEAAPVFKRMAQGVQEVLDAEREQSAGKLLELSGLVQSVLYTQGRTEAAGDRVPYEGTDMSLSTTVPYRKLHPVLEALTQKGQGRMEVLRQAEEEGLLQDWRVIPAAVAALDDSYAELAELLHRKIVPAYGRDALPALRLQFRLQGGKGDARRLELLHRLLGRDGLELYLEAAQTGSWDVRAAAIEVLGHYPEQEAFLLEQSEEKRKELRRAAYLALSRLGSERAQERLFRALNSKDRELSIEPIRQCEAVSLSLQVVRHAESVWEHICGGEHQEESIAQLEADLECLQGKVMAEVFELLRKLLSAPDGTPSPRSTEWERLEVMAARMLLQLDMPEADRFAVELQHARQGRFVTFSLRAAVKTLPPAEVFQRFAPEWKNNRSARRKDLIRTMEDLIPSVMQSFGEGSTDAAVHKDSWDPRWLDVWIETDNEELVCRLAHTTDKKVVYYLVRKCREAPGLQHHRTVELVLTLIRIGYKDVPELIMEILERNGGRQLYYLNRIHTALLEQLPAVYAERMKRFAETITYGDVRQQVLDLAEALQSKQEESATDKERGTGLWGWLKNRMS